MSKKPQTPIDLPRMTFAEFVDHAIVASGKTQTAIAKEMGFNSQVRLTRIKNGVDKMPINKVAAFAQAVGKDPFTVLGMALEEYSPELWVIVQSIIDHGLPTHEKTTLALIRSFSDGLPVAPTTKADVESLEKMVGRWKTTHRKRMSEELKAPRPVSRGKKLQVRG
ncbi:hypothetical protein LJC19_04745 [Oxalobacter sp. OttesenSCG-928-P03]|nr:hypothetical protein [Oxalobacter sp. OttesenSCG-928-P03]